jgi:hypothetical protein
MPPCRQTKPLRGPFTPDTLPADAYDAIIVGAGERGWVQQGLLLPVPLPPPLPSPPPVQLPAGACAPPLQTFLKCQSNWLQRRMPSTPVHCFGTSNTAAPIQPPPLPQIHPTLLTLSLS